MPKKQYYISTKCNKVYDITDRKNYCTNFCYKASLHIKNQIDNSPLWLRNPEHVPEYQLLEPTESNDELLPEVDDRDSSSDDESNTLDVCRPSTSGLIYIFQNSDISNSESESKKEEMPENNFEWTPSNLVPNKFIFNDIACYKKSSKLVKSTMQTIAENSEQLEDEEDVTVTKVINKNTKKIYIKKHDHANIIKVLPVIDENEEKADIKCDKIENVKKNLESSRTISKKARKKGRAQKIEIESLIHKAFKEWLTLDSYIFIHGESKVKEILSEKKLSDYFEELKITELQRDQQIKYMNICKRLQLQEMADEKFDNALIDNIKLKPIPDYRKLKEENKDLNFKVKSFYSGILHEREDTNFPTNKQTEGNEGESTAVLPLVDVNSQNAMRRKIFLTSVNKSMQQLLQSLRVIQFSSVLSDLQTLVKTFHLKADNIVFKPIVWNYISIILLNLLSLRDRNIKNILEEKQSKCYIELQVNALPSKEKCIDDIMTTIHNIDVFVENYISKK
ncbi:hypothetical protein NQ314_005678 [Rhamnusium bicolor]|uniref:protein-serine/threonine phosphatase n=1 Tax=Rhamnusium bicolor TaxID=1586634 RepID=A0AAV8ZHW5_9CUCU|nr:hypothetical protein NQ314_005678 [Rhamnusium bicolor]